MQLHKVSYIGSCNPGLLAGIAGRRGSCGHRAVPVNCAAPMRCRYPSILVCYRSWPKPNLDGSEIWEGKPPCQVMHTKAVSRLLHGPIVPL